MATWRGYTNVQPPPTTWRPGSDVSPFNRPVDKTQVHPRSQAKIDWLLSFDDRDTVRGLCNLEIPDRTVSGKSGAHAVVWADNSDPVFTIRQEQQWFPANEGKRIHIPAQAEAGQDGYDYQLCVVQPDGTSYDFGRFERRGQYRTYTPRDRYVGGDVWCNCVGVSSIYGSLFDGYGEATQGHAHLAAGQIRAEQMALGRINHALFLVVPGSARSGYFVDPVPQVGNKYRPPGGASDRIDVGQRLFLNYSGTAIDAMPIKPWEKVIYRALARYGGYVLDGGGPDVVAACVECGSGSSYVPFGLQDPWVTYAKQFAAPYNGIYVLRWTQGVIDWHNRLKVAA